MARTPLQPLGAPIDELLSEPERAKNAARSASLDAALQQKLDVVRAGWGPKYADRQHAKGKLTTWERIELLQDAGARFFPFGSLVNWGVDWAGSRRQAPGAGVVTGFVQVHGRWCVLIANDNCVASGSWWPRTPEKIQRAQEIAERMRLPVVYLVDCSGLFLPEQANSFPGKRGAGHIFKRNAVLSSKGVPQIAGVFGDCIAGGGYMPIISDRVYMTEQAYMVIAGAALIKGAKSLALTSLDIGGAEVHVGRSGCADVRVPDDPTCIQRLREEVQRLPSSGAEYYRHGATPMPPRFPASDLSEVFPADHRHTYDVRQVIARLVDGSLFHEVLADRGHEVVVGVARVNGLWVGLLANNPQLTDHPERAGEKRAGGILYRQGIAKLAAFSRTCEADGIPLIWLQDIAGFDIGIEAEVQGLLGYGSSLIYANSTNKTPMITVLLRKASGAGYYAMAGHPYDPVLQLSTPITRQAVMEGRTLAIAAFNTKLDDDFEIATTDPDERARIEQGMAQTAARIEADMDPVAAASRMDTDEVVPLSDLRAWLEVAVEASYQSIGYRTVKNPRIWSLHDLDALTTGPERVTPRAQADAVRVDDVLAAPTVGTWVPALQEGAWVQQGTVLGVLHRETRQTQVRAPLGTHGQALTPTPAGWVQYGDALVELGQVDRSADPGVTAADEAGLIAVRAPMAGTIYHRPSPADPAFAEPGQSLPPRATVALIEVMKTFTGLTVPDGGTLERYAVADGASVDPDQVVAWLRR
jgi:acetyl-CoA carboxylase carboxyltransferase component